MSNVKIIAERSDIVAIADAVRSKTGTSTEMTLEQIANEINNIETGVNESDIEAEIILQTELISEIQTSLASMSQKEV